MKIAIASDDKKNISEHFGRALGFIIVDIEENKIKGKTYRQNIGKSSGECGSCNHAAMIENVKDCDYVISFGMGQRIYNDLINSSIKPIVTEEEKVDKAVEQFLKDELKNRTDKLH